MEILFYGDKSNESTTVRKMLKEKNIKYREIKDGEYARFHISSRPMILLLDDDDEVFAKWVGILTPTALESLCDLSATL
jgi:hypothetical protein